MEKYWDLLIVGGGVLGTFSAFHALNKGFKVALIERNHQPRQATVRNFGQIVPSGFSVKWQAYGRKSLKIYRDFMDLGDFSIQNQGSFYLASNEDEKTLLEELAIINQDQAYPSHFLTKRALLDMQPNIRSDYMHHALYFPKELSVDPRQMVRQVLDYLCEQKGLNYFPYHLAIGLDQSGDHFTLRTSNQKVFKAKKLLICSGAEFQVLMPEYYPDSELETTLLQMMISQPQSSARLYGNILSGLSIRRYESFRDCPSYQEIKAREQSDPDLSAAGIHVLFKQTQNGQVIIGDSHHYADAHQKDSLGFDYERKVEALILREAKKMVLLDNWNIDRHWCGIYAQCKNKEIFEIEPETDLHILTGIGGKGMTAGPGFTFEFINRILDDD